MSDPPNDDEVLTEKEAARESRVSVNTLRRAHAAGKVKRLRLSPGRIGYTRRHLREWRNACVEEVR